MVHINNYPSAFRSLRQADIQDGRGKSPPLDKGSAKDAASKSGGADGERKSESLETAGTRVEANSKETYRLQDELTRLQVEDKGIKAVHSHLRQIHKWLDSFKDEGFAEEKRAVLQQNVEARLETVQGIVDKTRFNGEKLLEQKNSDEDEGGLNLRELTRQGLGDLSPASVYNSLRKLDQAISKLSAQRFRIGGMISHLRQKLDSVQATGGGGQAQEPLIRDGKAAGDLMSFTLNRVRLDSSQALLAQANTQVEKVFRLLAGVRET